MKTNLLTLLMFISSLSYCQWTDNYEVNTSASTSNVLDIKTSGTKDGKTYIVYWDVTDGIYNLVLKVQLLDAGGNKLFGDGGMIVNNLPTGTSTLSRDQMVDNEGNLYVVFTSTADSQRNGYLHKISQEGEQLFGENGINIGGLAYGAKVLPTEDGGAIVGYKNILKKYDSIGNMVWDSEVQISVPGTSSSFFDLGELTLLSDGSFIAIVHTRATSNTFNSIMWAQKYDVNGSLDWSTQVANYSIIYTTRLQIQNENDVIYLGYAISPPGTNRLDAFLQRINADGTLPWGINGSEFSLDQSKMEVDNSIVLDGNFVWSLVRTTTLSQSQYGTSIQKFDKLTGQRILSENAKIIFPLAVQPKAMIKNLQIFNSKPLFLFEEYYDNPYGQIKLGVSHLSENADFIWDDQFKYIATSGNFKDRLSFTKNYEGQSVAIWVENRGNGQKMYAQNFKIEEENVVPNDECENSIALSCGDSTTGSTVEANNSGGNDANDVFYTYTGNGSEQYVTISLCGSSFDTFLRVYSDCTLTDEIAFNDDSCGLQSELTFLSDGTSTYVILVEGFSGSGNSASGDFEINIICQDVPPAPQNCEDFAALSNDLEDGLFFGGQTSQRLATDIPVGDNALTIYGMEPTVIGTATTFEFIIYSDVDGVPGVELQTRTGSIVDQQVTGNNFGFDFIKYSVGFDTPLTLEPNTTYWIEVTSDADGWETTTEVHSRIGKSDVFANNSTSGEWVSAEGNQMVFKFICSELGVSELNASNLKHYPNPVKDVLNISDTKEISNISIFDLSGKQVYTQSVNNKQTQINIAHLATGVYIVKAKMKEEVKIFKIVKK